MINKKILIAAVLALSISVNAGCTVVDKPVTSGDTNVTEPGKNEEDAKTDKDKQESIMKEYENIINKENGMAEYISFVNENIEDLSPDNASKLTVKLEEMQKEYLSKLEEKYYASDIQNVMFEDFKTDYDLSNISVENVKDEETKIVLIETKELGYKVETAEGMFFPIIDYGFYGKYSAYTTPDIKAYIGIMTAESDKVPAKDAALVISWDEMFERAFDQEKFLLENKDSVKLEDVKALYKKYITFAVYGLNNTPLFIYDGDTMNVDAKAAYAKVIKKDSKLSQTLKDYYEIIENAGFKLTDKVKNYRDDLVKNEKYLP